jgi:hypothetical protein
MTKDCSVTGKLFHFVGSSLDEYNPETYLVAEIAIQAHLFEKYPC